MECNSCNVVHILGVKCHEFGCPEKWKDEKRKCKWCGHNFIPEEKEQNCCPIECDELYYN